MNLASIEEITADILDGESAEFADRVLGRLITAAGAVVGCDDDEYPERARTLAHYIEYAQRMALGAPDAVTTVANLTRLGYLTAGEVDTFTSAYRKAWGAILNRP
jgi:hypothetical protein